MKRGARATALLAVVGLVCPAAHPDGFALYEQASKAASLGGAFVAQADDPSAIFYNVGGLGLLEDKPIVTAGLSLLSLNESLYQGLTPGVGAGTTGEQDAEMTPLLHLYAIMALGPKFKAGIGVNMPFLLRTKWKSPDAFSGRFISVRSKLDTLDFNPSLGYRATPDLGVGFGIVYRTSSLEQSRRIQQVSPFTGSLQDIASEKLATSTEDGFGWNVGVLYRASEKVSLGLAYRSEIEVDFQGTGRLTQIETGNMQLDDLIAVSLPLDQDLGFLTSIQFPSLISLGIAYSLSDSLILEVDVNETGWSSYDEVLIDFPNNPELTRRRVENYSDSKSYRLGVRKRRKSAAEIRFGIAFDESPQPDTSVDPALPDADRTSFSIGYGKDWLDVAFQWIDLGRRKTTTNRDNFNGNYSTSFWLIGITVSM